jgi:hypothetical protein
MKKPVSWAAFSGQALSLPYGMETHTFLFQLQSETGNELPG